MKIYIRSQYTSNGSQQATRATPKHIYNDRRLSECQIIKVLCRPIISIGQGEVDLIGCRVIITRDVMAIDRYVLYLFENLSKQPFQVDDWVHQGNLESDNVCFKV